MMPNAPTSFTAADLAGIFGKSRAAVLKALDGSKPTEVRLVRGNETRVWELDALPEGLRTELQARANLAGCRQVANLTGGGWQPAVPLAECAPEAVTRAVQLREALATALARRNEPMGRTDFEQIGLDDYRRVFGHTITARHWWNLFNRTVERAGASADFQRTELYLEERPARKVEVDPGSVCNGNMLEFERVAARLPNPVELTSGEDRAMWLAAVETYAARVELGELAKAVKRELLDFLAERVPGLAKGREAIRKAFERRLQRWERGEYRAASLKDGRAEANRKRAKEIDPADLDVFIAHTVLACGGRVSQGVRECLKSGMASAELTGRIIENPASKSYVPAWLRERVRHEVAMLSNQHHGERQARDNGAYVERYWGCVPAMDWWSADDCTLPIYFHVPDGKGWFTLMRGQFLLMIDARSTCILGYALMPERNYNARVIRSLITRTCDEYGMPNRGFYFERGIWKDSLILTGRKGETALDWNQVEQGLREFGLQFVHAIRARSKPVERVLGALQNLMEGDLGYAGRDERRAGFEHFEKTKLAVERRKIDPRQHYYSLDQWDNRLAELCGAYNSEPQDGKMTCGLSPAAALAKFRPEEPPIRLSASCRHLLSHHKRPVRVGLNGVTLRFGKEAFNYRSEETGRLIGQTVLAWFDPDVPEILTITDMDRRNAFCVERSQQVPALDAPAELLEQELERAGAHMSYAKTRYRILKRDYDQIFRPNLVSRGTVEMGQLIDQERTGMNRRQEKQNTRAQAVARRAEKLGLGRLPARIDEHVDEGTRLMWEAQQAHTRKQSEGIDL